MTAKAETRTVPPNLQGLQIDVRWIMRELLEEQRVSQEDFNVISTTPREKKEISWHPAQIVAKYQLADPTRGDKLIDMDFLSGWLAEKAGLPLFHVDPLKVKVDQVTTVMSYVFAERHGLLCVDVGRDSVTVACDQPFRTEWQDNLRQVLRDRELKVVFANPADIRRYRIEFYKLSRSIAGARDNTGQDAGGVANFEQLLELGGKTSLDAEDQHVVAIVDWILQYAFAQRASDIHLEPRRETGKMRFRIDGVLHEVYELPGLIMKAVTARLKILSRLNVAEKRKPQDGRLKTVNTDGEDRGLGIIFTHDHYGPSTFQQIGLYSTILAEPAGSVWVTRR